MAYTVSDADFQAFERAAREQGFDQVVERHWEPLVVLDTHTHPFAVRARVSAGQMWLTVDGVTRHLLPGAEFSLDAGVPHAERYGPAGASFWVARRHVTPLQPPAPGPG
jgi:quercetin dioxygenase-like cupin family protein